MNEEKGFPQVISEKAGILSAIIAKKFGSNPEATANGGQDNQTGGGNTMRVTRSAGSNAPGEVQDGKLVDVKHLAAAAARNDVPPTDLLALARQMDPHNENNIPETIASTVTAGDKGLPGQNVAEDNSMTGALGNIETERKQSLHEKQHGPADKAVNTDVNSQLSDKDPYKSLHAGAEVEQIVARAKALIKGAADIKEAATEVTKNPGVGKPEDGGQGKVSGDAGKDPEASAKTLGDGGAAKAAGLNASTNRKDVLAAIRAEVTERQAKVEGALVDPAKGADAGKDPAASAKTMGDGGSEKSGAAAGQMRVADAVETKSPPHASMPDNKRRYPPDEDGRDKEAKSYWEKNRKDEARFDKEPAKDRPITKEVQEKMPKLAPEAALRQDLLTRLAGLEAVMAAEDGEAARLHLKRRHYNKDEAGDMDYGGAAGRTKSEINKEHGQRSSDTGSLSPNMSRLWSAYGPIKLAAEGFKGEIGKPADKGEAKKQVEEMKTALKGLKAEDSGADSAMHGMQEKIEKMEGDMAKSSGVGLGQKSISALATAQDRLAVIAAVLSDAARLCQASHMEVRFALDKPHGTGVSDDMTTLLEDLGETLDDMEGTIDAKLKEMGHPGLKDKDPWKGGKPGDMGGPGAPGGAAPGPKGPAADLPGTAPAPMPELGAAPKTPIKTAFEVEDEAVEKVAADAALSPEQRKAKIAELRAGAAWSAAFNKVASKEDATKADILASYWEVKRGEEQMLRVSVSDAYPVKTAAEQQEAYAWFATKDYGRKLLASAKFEGLGKTARLLGLVNVRTAAGAFDEYRTKRPAAPAAALEGSAPAAALKSTDLQGYYAKAYGSPEFASELVKEQTKAAARESELTKRIAALEGEKKAEKDRNDRLQADIAMRAKAARALDLALEAMGKGMFGEEHKASFIDNLMLGDDKSFTVASAMVKNFKPVTASTDGAEKKGGSITAKELLRIAAAGPGLKTAIVSETAPAAGLVDQLQNMWRKPPTAQ